MRRVLVVGCSGTGKSTFAAALGRKLGLPVVHLDGHFWRPGWVQCDLAGWPQKVAELLDEPEWVMDGNFLATLEARLAACDTVIFLDRGRLVCLWRVIKRWFLYRSRTRPDLPEGCPERIDWEFYRWVWRYSRDVRPAMLARLQQAEDKRVLIFHSDLETAEFLEGL